MSAELCANACMLLSATAVVVLSVWGIQLLNEAPELEVKPEMKHGAGVSALIAAVMYAATGVYCYIWLSKNKQKKSQRGDVQLTQLSGDTAAHM
eukprot:GDKI01034004.1.p1 GENE.GDKI01034004.1~~GDKI01034004.1.p1  ORF type:complete len:109 (+),score=22.96 GDKI01034004.1:47-328(+)